MSALERNAIVKKGALFFESDGTVQFQYTIDASSIIGPRKATDQDKKDHAGAWASFLETLSDDPFSQLDHDGDGRPGGSLPRAESAPKRRGRPRKA
jgi:hypothetical protein